MPENETVLRVEGMMCGHCTASVERALTDVPGVESVVSVDLESKEARVRGQAAVADLIAACEAIGKNADDVTPTADSMEVVLAVADMMCDHCTGSVEKALLAVPGVVSAKVELDNGGRAFVNGSADLSCLVAACHEVGHPAKLAEPPPEEPIILAVADMMCDHCTGSVEKALLAVPGVVSAKVELDNGGRAFVNGSADLSCLVAACHEVGHPAKLAEPLRGSALLGEHQQTGGSSSSSRSGRLGSGLLYRESSRGESLPAGSRPGSRRSSLDAGGLDEASVPTGRPSERAAFANGTTPLLRRVSNVFQGEHDQEMCMLAISGMTCAACVSAVERALYKYPGILNVRLPASNPSPNPNPSSTLGRRPLTPTPTLTHPQCLTAGLASAEPSPPGSSLPPTPPLDSAQCPPFALQA